MTESAAPYVVEATVVDRQIQVVWGDNQEASFVNIGDILREGEELTQVNDTELLGRVARWLDKDDAELRGFQVTRPESGNVLVSPAPVFG
jgi:hypothetical protein